MQGDFIITYEWTQSARVFPLASLSRLVKCKTLAYWAIHKLW
jgi:hypothetical protein